MTSLSLDCLTLLDASPTELIKIASAAEYSAVSLWIQPPALPGGTLATSAMAADIRQALADTGVALGNLEVFNLNFKGSIAEFEPVLELGAELGAASATAINYGPERGDLAERFAQFHDLTKRYGLDVLIEPISMSDTRTLQDAVDLIEAANVDAGIVVDFLHLVRTGGTANDLASVDPRYISYIQICDGPATLPEDKWGAESTDERLYPGDGDWPLVELMRAVPENTPLAVETPSKSRKDRGVSPLDRARQVMIATRNLLSLVNRSE